MNIIKKNSSKARRIVRGARQHKRKLAPRQARRSINAASYACKDHSHRWGGSIDRQQELCRRKATENGYTISKRLEFSDDSLLDTLWGRPGLAALAKAAAAGEFATLYVDHLSRLHPDFRTAMRMVVELVQLRKIRVISTTEGLDSIEDTPSYFAFWHFFKSDLLEYIGTIPRGSVYLPASRSNSHSSRYAKKQQQPSRRSTTGKRIPREKGRPSAAAKQVRSYGKLRPRRGSKATAASR